MTSHRSRAAAEPLEPRRLLAAAQLVKDINTSHLNATFVPSNLAAAGSVAYFADHDGTTGDELWKTDGTAAGTVLVKDINPGPAGSYPGGFTTVNGVTYFDASDATDGAELWRTDGTAAGTYRVADINPGVASSSPSDFVAYDGDVFFFADDGVHGRELWKTDGTPAGTVLVDDTDPGAAGQSLQSISIHRLAVTGNGKLFFYASNGSTTGVYTTTGVVGNETLVQALTYGVVQPGIVAGTSLAFYVDGLGYVYQSDGTTAGTVTADATNSTASNLTVAGSYLYYNRGTNLYAVGGGVKRTVTGAFTSPTLIGSANGVAYFTAASSTTTHQQLWYANVGGFGGTLVQDGITAVTGVAAGSGFAFVAGSSSFGYTLNYTTGTAASDVSLGTVNAGGSLAAPSGLTAFGSSELLFVNTDPTNGTQPWASNLTAAGTGLLKVIYPGTAAALPFLFNLGLNGHLLFQANDGVTGQELWTTDGTAAGTVEVKDIYPGLVGSGPNQPLLAGNRVYFSATDPTDGTALFSTDGTTAGTAVVPGTASTNPTPLAYVNGEVLFAGTDATHGTELWRTDGTAAGTSLLADLNPGADSSDPSAGVVLNGVFYFPATDDAHGTELWRSDGTAAGTYLLADIYAGASSSNPSNLFAYGNHVLFAATTAAAGTELWSTDGTTAGTVLLKDVYAGTSSSTPSAFALYDGRAYFSAKDATGTGLWSTDGTTAGTTLVDAAVTPLRLVAADGLLFFVGTDATRPGKLFTSQGTAATTGPIANAALTGITGNLSPIGGQVFFLGTDATHGTEVWTSDGTAAGTGVVDDLFPGVYPGAVGTIVGLNGAAYFDGTDGVSGAELYKVADTFPPELTAAAATVAPAGRQVTFTFGENVSSKLSAASLQLLDLTTGTTVTTSATGYSYDPTANMATFTLPAAALADGRYRATLAAASIVDPAGNVAAAAATLEFVAVAGAAAAVGIAPSADGTSLVVSKNGVQTFTTPLAGLGSVVVTGAASTTDADVAVPGGISIDGTGPVTVLGATGPHVVAATSTGLMFDTTTVTTASSPITFDPAGGTDGLTVSGVRLALAAAPAASTARVFSSLDLSDGGTLDVANNDLVLTGSTLAAMTALAATGYAGGAWTGPGLDSSAAAADTTHLTALGVIQNLSGSTALYATFDGVAVTASAVLVKYTDYGDTNLDGRVDVADYTRLDAGFVGKLSGWANGDENYDGLVDGSDYTLVDNAFNQQPAAANVATPATATVRPAAVAAGQVPAVATPAVAVTLRAGRPPVPMSPPPDALVPPPAPTSGTDDRRRSLAEQLLDLLR